MYSPSSSFLPPSLPSIKTANQPTKNETSIETDRIKWKSNQANEQTNLKTTNQPARNERANQRTNQLANQPSQIREHASKKLPANPKRSLKKPTKHVSFACKQSSTCDRDKYKLPGITERGFLCPSFVTLPSTFSYPPLVLRPFHSP